MILLHAEALLHNAMAEHARVMAGTITQRMDGAEQSVRAALHAPMHAIYRLRKMSEQSGSQEGPRLKCSRQELWQIAKL